MSAFASRKALHAMTSLCMAVLLSVGPAAHADDASTCKLHPVGKLPLSFVGYGLNPVMPATINGKSTLALISTANGAITLGKAALNDMGIATPRTSQVILMSGGGTAHVYSANIDELKIGPMKGSGEYEVNEMTRNYGVVLGMNSLLQFDLEVDLSAKYLRFFQPEKCKGVSLAYWEGEAASVPFTVTSRDFSPTFTIKINGKETRAKLSLFSEYSILDLRAAKDAGISPAMPGARKETNFVMGTGTDEVWNMPIDSLEIGTERIGKARIMVANLEPSDDQIILGTDFIRSHRILLSMVQKQMYFSYLGGPLFVAPGSNNKNPWYRAEAEQGNPYAQYRMGNLYDRADTQPADASEAVSWYGKAAAQGHANAKYRLGQEHFIRAEYKESARLFREAAASKDFAPAADEMLYLAEARLGDKAAAARALDDAVAAKSTSAWTKTVLRFYRGEIDGAKLLGLADATGIGAKPQRRCDAFNQTGEFQLLRGDAQAAKAAFTLAVAACTDSPLTKRLALAELERLNGTPDPTK
ncbi:MAG: hypothetical protein ABIT83_06810 [Massilia sp.]